MMDRGIDMSDRFCSDCGSTNTFIHPKRNRPLWNNSKITGKLLCKKCYHRENKELKKIQAASYSNDPTTILGSMKSLDYLIGVMKNTTTKEELEMKEDPSSKKSKKIKRLRERVDQINEDVR